MKAKQSWGIRSSKLGIFPRGAGASYDQAPSFSGGSPGSQGFFPGGHSAWKILPTGPNLKGIKVAFRSLLETCLIVVGKAGLVPACEIGAGLLLVLEVVLARRSG